MEDSLLPSPESESMNQPETSGTYIPSEQHILPTEPQYYNDEHFVGDGLCLHPFPSEHCTEDTCQYLRFLNHQLFNNMAGASLQVCFCIPCQFDEVLMKQSHGSPNFVSHTPPPGVVGPPCGSNDQATTPAITPCPQDYREEPGRQLVSTASISFQYSC